MWKRSAIIIPGAQKSGTTTLFKMLSQHSRVDRSRLKEPQFFALDDEVIEETFSWYQGLFSQDDTKPLLDASTFYLRSRGAPARIEKHLADSRIVIVLRDPAQRAYSSYLHMHTKEPPADGRRFGAILDEVAAAVGRRSVRQAEDDAVERAVERGDVDARYLDEGYHRRFFGAEGKPISTRVEDPLFLYRYLQQSMYRREVDRYVEIFGAERVKVCFFEKLLANPEATMRGLLDFLQLEPEAPALELQHGNKTHPPRSKLKQRLLDLRRDSTVMDFLIEGLNRLGLSTAVRSAEQFVRKPPPKPRLSKAQYEQTRALLAGEYAYWCRQEEALNRLWSY